MEYLSYYFAINFVDAQEGGNPEDVINVGAQTGDLFTFIVGFLLAAIAIASITIFFVRKRSLCYSGKHSILSNAKFNKSQVMLIICSLFALFLAFGIFTLNGVSKAVAANDDPEVIPINAQVFDDGHIEVDEATITNTAEHPVIFDKSILMLDETVMTDQKLQASVVTAKALGGIVYEGNPDESEYSTLDAYDRLYPGETATINFYIDNLDGSTANSYIGKQVYLFGIECQDAVVPIPEATNFTYNGQEVQGVPTDSLNKYTLSEGQPHPATSDIGAVTAKHVNRNSISDKVNNYVTKLTLNPGFVWDDELYPDRPIQLSWKINPCQVQFTWEGFENKTYNNDEVEYSIQISNLQHESGSTEEQDKIVPVYSITKDAAPFDIADPIIDAGEYQFIVTGLSAIDAQSKVSDYALPEAAECTKSLTVLKRTLTLSEIMAIYLDGYSRYPQKMEQLNRNWYEIDYNKPITPNLTFRPFLFYFTDETGEHNFQVPSSNFTLTADSKTDIGTYSAKITANNSSNFTGSITVPWYIYQPTEVNLDNTSVDYIQTGDDIHTSGFVAFAGFDTLTIYPKSSISTPYTVYAYCVFDTGDVETRTYVIDGSSVPGPLEIDVPKDSLIGHFANNVTFWIEPFVNLEFTDVSSFSDAPEETSLQPNNDFDSNAFTPGHYSHVEVKAPGATTWTKYNNDLKVPDYITLTKVDSDTLSYTDIDGNVYLFKVVLGDTWNEPGISDPVSSEEHVSKYYQFAWTEQVYSLSSLDYSVERKVERVTLTQNTTYTAPAYVQDVITSENKAVTQTVYPAFKVNVVPDSSSIITNNGFSIFINDGSAVTTKDNIVGTTSVSAAESIEFVMPLSATTLDVQPFVHALFTENVVSGLPHSKAFVNITNQPGDSDLYTEDQMENEIFMPYGTAINRNSGDFSLLENSNVNIIIHNTEQYYIWQHASLVYYVEINEGEYYTFDGWEETSYTVEPVSGLLSTFTYNVSEIAKVAVSWINALRDIYSYQIDGGTAIELTTSDFSIQVYPGQTVTFNTAKQSTTTSKWETKNPYMMHGYTFSVNSTNYQYAVTNPAGDPPVQINQSITVTEATTVSCSPFVPVNFGDTTLTETFDFNYSGATVLKQSSDGATWIEYINGEDYVPQSFTLSADENNYLNGTFETADGDTKSFTYTILPKDNFMQLPEWGSGPYSTPIDFELELNPSVNHYEISCGGVDSIVNPDTFRIYSTKSISGYSCDTEYKSTKATEENWSHEIAGTTIKIDYQNKVPTPATIAFLLEYGDGTSDVSLKTITSALDTFTFTMLEKSVRITIFGNLDLSFGVTPEGVTPATVQIWDETNHNWINYVDRKSSYVYGTNFVVDSTDSTVLNVMDSDGVTVLDKYKLTWDSSSSYTYAWNPSGYFFIGATINYTATEVSLYRLFIDDTSKNLIQNLTIGGSSVDPSDPYFTLHEGDVVIWQYKTTNSYSLAYMECDESGENEMSLEAFWDQPSWKHDVTDVSNYYGFTYNNSEYTDYVLLHIRPNVNDITFVDPVESAISSPMLYTPAIIAKETTENEFTPIPDNKFEDLPIDCYFSRPNDLESQNGIYSPAYSLSFFGYVLNGYQNTHFRFEKKDFAADVSSYPGAIKIDSTIVGSGHVSMPYEVKGNLKRVMYKVVSDEIKDISVEEGDDILPVVDNHAVPGGTELILDIGVGEPGKNGFSVGWYPSASTGTSQEQNFTYYGSSSETPTQAKFVVPEVVQAINFTYLGSKKAVYPFIRIAFAKNSTYTGIAPGKVIYTINDDPSEIEWTDDTNIYVPHHCNFIRSSSDATQAQVQWTLNTGEIMSYKFYCSSGLDTTNCLGWDRPSVQISSSLNTLTYTLQDQ